MADQDVVADREPIVAAIPVSLGASSILRIPVPGTKGLAIELSPRGWKPKTGSTSSLFIQDLTGKRHLRLDFGFNKNSQVFEWHWNQKGTSADFGITNHTSVGQTEQLLGQMSKVYRFAGRALTIGAAATDLHSIVTSSEPLRRSVQVVSGWAAAAEGCKVVGAGGAYLGTAAAPGIGTAVGGFLGCSAGAFIGYMSAERVSGHLYDWAAGAMFSRLHPEPVWLPNGTFVGGGGRSGGGGARGSW
jgi:hypothetical protein